MNSFLLYTETKLQTNRWDQAMSLSHRHYTRCSRNVAEPTTLPQSTGSHTDKPLRLCPCLMDATRCSRNVAKPTTLPLYWQPHRRTVETMSLSHGRYSLQQECCWTNHSTSLLAATQKNRWDYDPVSWTTLLTVAGTLLARLVLVFGAKTVITQFLMNIQQLATLKHWKKSQICLFK